MVGAHLMVFQLISHTVNLLLHKANSTNFISQKFSDSPGYISVQALHFRLVTAQGSIAGFSFFLPFCHSRNIFTNYFVTARVDYGIAFSIKFLSSSALLGFRKALEQEAMSSSVSRRKAGSKHVWDLMFLHTNLYLKCFSRMQISNIHECMIVMKSIDTRFFRNIFEAVQKTRSTCFIGSKTTRPRLVVLNLINYCCVF